MMRDLSIPRRVGAALVVGAMVLAIAGSVRAATTIIQHEGANDPTTEGFSNFFGQTSNNTVGPVTNDSGFDAWSVDKPGATDQRGYTYNLSAPQDLPQLSDASLLPWDVTVRLRVAPDGNTATFATSVLFSVGTKRFDMIFGSNANGDPIVMLVTSYANDGQQPIVGTSATVSGGNGYHLYHLYYDPQTQQANLYVDGNTTPAIANFAGNTLNLNPPSIKFGAFGDSGTGTGYYSLVQLVPEPSGFSMLFASAAWLFGRRRRRV